MRLFGFHPVVFLVTFLLAIPLQILIVVRQFSFTLGTRQFSAELTSLVAFCLVLLQPILISGALKLVTFLPKLILGAPSFLVWLVGGPVLPPRVEKKAPRKEPGTPFFEWLFAPDHLPSRVVPRKIEDHPEVGFLTWLFDPEFLPPSAPERTSPPGQSAFSWLFGIETLPQAPDQSRPKAESTSFARWLFGREELSRSVRKDRKEGPHASE